MRAISRLFLFVLLVSAMDASARLPETKSEESLLYWRYLCRNQPQREPSSTATALIELSCPEQGWTVRASPKDGKVREILQ